MIDSGVPCGPGRIGRGSQILAAGADALPLLWQARMHGLERVRQRAVGTYRWVPGQQVHVIVSPIAPGQGGAEVAARHAGCSVRYGCAGWPAHLAGTWLQRPGGRARRTVPIATMAVGDCLRPSVDSGAVLVRYRYRLRLTPGQQMQLARAFGCARVVYNDALRLREESHAAGVK